MSVNKSLSLEIISEILQIEESTPTTDKQGNTFWKLPNGDLHRVYGPAIAYSNGSEEWLMNGKRHRENGPAVFRPDGYQEWWLEDNLHHKNGPAILSPSGHQEWWVNGEMHRENGPALISKKGDWDYWYLSGKLHRLNCPASISSDMRKIIYWIHGNYFLSEKAYMKALFKKNQK